MKPSTISDLTAGKTPSQRADFFRRNPHLVPGRGQILPTLPKSGGKAGETGKEAGKGQNDSRGVVAQVCKSVRKGPNKTESEAGRMLVNSGLYADVRYEGITLRLKNGARYTPDWFCIHGLGCKPVCVEVKNAGYRHASYGRSRMAWAQAAIDYPCFEFRWMDKVSGGCWKMERGGEG